MQYQHSSIHCQSLQAQLHLPQALPHTYQKQPFSSEGVHGVQLLLCINGCTLYIQYTVPACSRAFMTTLHALLTEGNPSEATKRLIRQMQLLTILRQSLVVLRIDLLEQYRTASKFVPHRLGRKHSNCCQYSATCLDSLSHTCPLGNLPNFSTWHQAIHDIVHDMSSHTPVDVQNLANIQLQASYF